MQGVAEIHRTDTYHEHLLHNGKTLINEETIAAIVLQLGASYF